MRDRVLFNPVFNFERHILFCNDMLATRPKVTFYHVRSDVTFCSHWQTFIQNESSALPESFPLSEEELKACMDPVSIVESRVSFGGPQAEEMPNQMEDLNERVGFFEDFVIDTNYQITDGLRMLKEDLKQI